MVSRGWDNLGDWSTATTFEDAARALAVRLARAIDMGPGQHILDVGFGYGAELELWLDAFDVAHVAGLEPNMMRVRAARRRLGRRVELHCGTASMVEACFRGARLDGVLALDNIYHFNDRDAFFDAAHSVLKPGGRLGFTTLVLEPTRYARAWSGIAPAFGVVDASSLTVPGLRRGLERAGFGAISVERLDAEVMRGFARYVARGGAWERPGIREALRFGLTGLACALGPCAGLGYAQVVARR